MTLRHVLFLCTHNSARSQMAEGFLRAFGGDRFRVASAGTEETHVVNPQERLQVFHRVGMRIRAWLREEGVP